jgi:hypothetical protein
MRSAPFVVVLVVCAGLGLASIGAAQTAARPPIPPTIHNVTQHDGSGVLTITGTGLGANLVVTIDGQPVAVLSGATATQVEVLAPAAVLTVPGTYRLTLVDPVRQVGDAFVIAGHANEAWSGIAPGGQATAMSAGAASDASSAPRGLQESRPLDGPTPAGRVSPMLLEDSVERNTAVGFQALASNTSGVQNTASGYQALSSNNVGHRNTGTGSWALHSNTTGFWNVASGADALAINTSGSGNTASGYRALYASTSGDNNTASGVRALTGNTTGSNNTASGVHALLSNTTGISNTAVGYQAGYNATTGSHNLFLGAAVTGTAADAHTIRIGLPYDGSIGQNQTFIAGIYGTELPGAGMPVLIDADGRLGTLLPSASVGGAVPLAAPGRALADALTRLTAVTRQVQDQEATIAALRVRLARLEALLVTAASRK